MQETASWETLAKVKAKLDAAVDLLVCIRLDDGPSGRDQLIGEAATLLGDVHLHWQCKDAKVVAMAADPTRPDLAVTGKLQLLRGIEVRAIQLQRLNDGAIGLCRGWLSVEPRLFDGYTPEGILADTRESGSLRTGA